MAADQITLPQCEIIQPRNFYEAAKQYIRMGGYVFPIAARSKAPLTAHGVLDASNYLPQIKQWCEKWPDAGIAIAARGKDVGELCFLEFDQKPTLSSWAKALGQPMPETRIHLSGGKKLPHFVFKHTDKSLALGNCDGEGDYCEVPKCPDNKSGGLHKHEWFSFRACNRYVLAPPSIHPVSGDPYNVFVNTNPVSIPDWIVDAIAARGVREKQVGEEMGAVPVSPNFDFHSLLSYLEVIVKEVNGAYHGLDICPAVGYRHEGQNDRSTAFWWDGSSLGFKCFAQNCPSNMGRRERADGSVEGGAACLMRLVQEKKGHYDGEIWTRVEDEAITVQELRTLGMEIVQPAWNFTYETESGLIYSNNGRTWFDELGAAKVSSQPGVTLPQVTLPQGYEDAKPVQVADPHEDRPNRIYPLTDVGNAERLAFRYGGELLYTDATGWMRYEHGIWKRDTEGRADFAMVRTIRRIYLEADLVDEMPEFSEKSTEEKMSIKEGIIMFGKKCESNARINNALNRAANDPMFRRDYAKFDQHPYFFNCKNGTLDLRTSEFLRHDPNHLLTCQSPIRYDPKAECPRWEQFILDIMDGKKHMRAYIARCCGYTISADIGEESMFMPWGQGGTGKSTFLAVIRGVMGDYCKTADAEMFMVKRGDSGQPFEFAGKEGVRMLMAVETEEGKRLALAKVKRMTGKDPITACYKFQTEYEYVPQWKIWLATNDAPDTRAEDDAWWDRAKPIPFDVKFRGTHKEVKNFAEVLLREEGPGILNWCIAGHQMWKQEGLKHPEDVKAAAAEWRDRDDYLQRFLDEYIRETSVVAKYAPKSMLFGKFGDWAEQTKEGRGINDKRFTEAMIRKGYKHSVVKQDGKSVRCWIGIQYMPYGGWQAATRENMDDLTGGSI